MSKLTKAAYGVTYAVVFATLFTFKWIAIIVWSVIFAALTFDRRR